MRILFFLLLIAGSTIVSCGRPGEHAQADVDALSMSREERIAAIKNLESKAMTTGDTLDPVIGQQLMVSYLGFVNANHQDTLAGDYLFKAAEIAMNMGKYRLAIQHFTTVHDNYLTYKNQIEAGYMVPFIYDYHLHDRDMARDMYGRIAEGYPKHPYGIEAQTRLTTLHLTDDQLIEMFKKKNAQSQN